jgi:hypothetical protein
MSLLHYENFESLNDASLPCKYTLSADANATHSIVTDTWAGQALKINRIGRMSVLLPNSPSTVIVGCLFKYDRLNNATRPGLALINIIGIAVTHLEIRIAESGLITIIREGGAGTILDTGTIILKNGVWYHLEIKTTISNSGSIVINIDGIEDVNFSGDTQNGTSSVVDRCGFGLENTNSLVMEAYYKNTYICDSAGSTNNDFLGNIVIETLRPTADGTTNDFTPLNAGDNYVEVDEASQDGDTSYNSSSTVGNIDLFGMDNISNTINSVLATGINIAMKKTDGTNRLITDVIRQGGTNYSGQGDKANSGANISDYTYHTSIHETDPNTSVAWTEAGVNSAETGYEIDS